MGFACAYMLCDAGWLHTPAAVLLAMVGNFAGYAKYYVQMWYNHEYVATSIFLYLLSFMTLACLQTDLFYFILMVYPFMVLLRVPKYADMKGRKILFSDMGIILHCCDHLIHGTITCSVVVYHAYGLLGVIVTHLFVVPLGYCLSDGMTRIQQGEMHEGNSNPPKRGNDRQYFGLDDAVAMWPRHFFFAVH